MSYKILKPELNRKIKGVLFDMDGLLLDTERLYVENWMIASKEAGFPMTFEETLGLRSLDFVARQKYLEGIKGPLIKDEPIRLRMDYLTDQYIINNEARLKKGAREILAYLEKAKLKRAIASSSAMHRIERNLNSVNLLNKFDSLCSGYEVKNSKPSPDIYLYAAKSLNLDPKDCISLEDSPNGIFAGVSANTLAIVIPDLDKPSKEVLDRAYAICDSLLDVIDIIRFLNGDLNEL